MIPYFRVDAYVHTGPTGGVDSNGNWNGMVGKILKGVTYIYRQSFFSFLFSVTRFVTKTRQIQLCSKVYIPLA